LTFFFTNCKFFFFFFTKFLGAPPPPNRNWMRQVWIKTEASGERAKISLPMAARNTEQDWILVLAIARVSLMRIGCNAFRERAKCCLYNANFRHMRVGYQAISETTVNTSRFDSKTYRLTECHTITSLFMPQLPVFDTASFQQSP